MEPKASCGPRRGDSDDGVTNSHFSHRQKPTLQNLACAVRALDRSSLPSGFSGIKGLLFATSTCGASTLEPSTGSSLCFGRQLRASHGDHCIARGKRAFSLIVGVRLIGEPTGKAIGIPCRDMKSMLCIFEVIFCPEQPQSSVIQNPRQRGSATRTSDKKRSAWAAWF
jgi:hypothetical protein